VEPVADPPVNAAFLAAAAREPINHAHLAQATRNEFVKLERPQPEEEIRTWGISGEKNDGR